MLKNLPKTIVDLSIRNQKALSVILPNLLIRFEEIITDKDRELMLQSYQILDGETPEKIAQKLYENPEYDWTIMFVNKLYDYVADFPMSSHLVEKHAIKKYGADHIYDIHHYEDIYGNVQDEMFYNNKDAETIPKGVYANEPVWKSYYSYSSEGTDKVLLKRGKTVAITNIDHESNENEKKRLIWVIKPQYITKFVQHYNETVAALA